MQIGEKIKQLRIKTNLTQEELANRSELSKGFISQLERNLTSPSISTLVDILDCLGTSLKDFFNDNYSDKIVFHKDDIFIQENKDLGHIIKWIIPNSQKNKMEPIILNIKKNGQSSIYSAHKGEVFGYILQGNINIHLGEQKFIAEKGESFYYKADYSYYLNNNSSTDSIVLLISTPPNF